MSSLVAQKSSMNRRTLMRQNLRRSVQPTNPHQVQVSRSVATKETNKEQIKQRAIKEMTKTWESSTNISKDNDKNTGFRRIANLALQKYKASLRLVFKSVLKSDWMRVPSKSFENLFQSCCKRVH